MYPHQYYTLFPPFPRENKVFVAMSFHPMFKKRWESVIAPAIKRIERNNIRLEPYRVDIRRVSDSILTEILTGLSSSRMIFADISSIGRIEDKPIRNGNVMYEVGLAHATRLPEEVILFRSDKDDLLFDVANVRVNSYDPDVNPETAINLVTTVIVEAIKEVDLKKHLSVKSAAESLDYSCWDILIQTAAIDGIYPPSMKTMGEVLGNQRHISAISHLLEIGALKTDYLQITSDLLTDINNLPAEKMLKYKLTHFGSVLIDYVVSEMGILSPEIQQKLEKLLKDSGDSIA
jgi:hypothetical protein